MFMNSEIFFVSFMIRTSVILLHTYFFFGAIFNFMFINL